LDTPRRAAVQAELLAPTQDVYLGIGVRREPLDSSQRGNAEDVMALPALYLDLDITHRVHKRQNLPPDRDAARRLLADFPLPPSILVDSGHGFQAYWTFTELWRFDTPDERWEAQLLVRRLQATFQDMARRKGWVVDSTFDLARVLRLPGTMNRKCPEEPVPVVMVSCEPERRYRRDEIEPYVVPADQLVRVSRSPRQISLPADLPRVRLESLQISARMRAVIRKGADPLDPWRYATRSEAVAAVITALMVADYDDVTIASVLLDPALGISAKPREQGRGWVAQELARMRAKVKALQTQTDQGPTTTMGVKPFPVHVFPQQLRRYVQGVAAEMSAPVDYAALAVLTTAASAIGNSREITLKGRYHEGPILYVGLVGDTGAKKTPTISRVLAPLEYRQQRYYRQYQEEMVQYQDALSQYNKARPGAMRARAPGQADRSLPDAGAVATVSPKAPRPPILVQLYTTDPTREALVDALQRNPRGLLMVRDELVGWVYAMNQYKGGRGDDRPFYLSAWSARSLIINRKGSGGTVIVPRPCLSVIGGVTPDMLHTLADARGREDGFLQRILFCYPDPSDEEWTEATVPVPSERAWGLILRRLWQLRPATAADGSPRPREVMLSAPARETWRRFLAAHRAEVRDPTFPPYLKGAWDKLRSYAARLALIVHELRRACGEAETEEVDEVSMRAAWALSDYFKSHARRVYQELQRPQKAKRLQTQVERAERWIKANGGRCTVRQLQHHNVAGIQRATEAKRVLADLADLGRGRFKVRETPKGRQWRGFVLTGKRRS
jgi:hypothetical protein